MKLIVSVAVLLVIGIGGRRAAADPIGPPQIALNQARVAYEQGNYDAAVERLHPLLYPRIELGTEESVVEAHRLLALSYFFMKKELQAEQEVSSLLTLRPGFELDPVVDPPQAVSFFQTIRHRQEARLSELQRLEREEHERERKETERRRAEERAKVPRIVVEKRVERHSRWLALLPFGVGQWQNGHRRLAVLFAVSEALLGALSVASWIALTTRFPDGNVRFSEKNLASGLWSTQLASGAAFWAVVLTGMIEAQVRFVPQVVRGTGELPAAPQSQPLHSSLSLAPVIEIAPGLYGLSIMGAF